MLWLSWESKKKPTPQEILSNTVSLIPEPSILYDDTLLRYNDIPVFLFLIKLYPLIVLSRASSSKSGFLIISPCYRFYRTKRTLVLIGKSRAQSLNTIWPVWSDCFDSLSLKSTLVNSNVDCFNLKKTSFFIKIYWWIQHSFAGMSRVVVEFWSGERRDKDVSAQKAKAKGVRRSPVGETELLRPTRFRAVRTRPHRVSCVDERCRVRHSASIRWLLERTVGCLLWSKLALVLFSDLAVRDHLRAFAGSVSSASHRNPPCLRPAKPT